MESGPVFADPSGTRHHVVRLAGVGVAVVLAVCLGAVVVAMTGGPRAPLTQWVAPRSPAGAPGVHAARQGAAHATASGGAPGAAGPASARAVPSASAGRSATPATSPAATNSAGRTPPGQVKSPNAHKPSVAA